MQINKFTSNIGLQYDSIYYFPSRTDKLLNEVMAEAVDRWKCNGEIWCSELYLPKYKLQVVPEELMSELYKEAAPDAPECEYTRELLRKMLGSEDGGVLLVRLYPKDKEAPDELLVCPDIPSYMSSEIDCTLNTIAEKAFHENFERITGMSYPSYKKSLDKEIENQTNRSTDLTIMGNKEFSARKTPDFKARRRMDVFLGKMKSQIDTARNEDLIKYVEQLKAEIKDENKLKTRRKILVEYEDYDDYDKSSLKYEIYVVKNEDVRIRCDFGRDLCKVFYVFLLKHQGGVKLEELYKYRNELIQLYGKFSNFYKGNHADSVDSISSDNKRINQLKSLIKKTFDEVFGAAIASDYYVYGTADSYSIKLDRKYVDLGEFES